MRGPAWQSCVAACQTVLADASCLLACTGACTAAGCLLTGSWLKLPLTPSVHLRPSVPVSPHPTQALGGQLCTILAQSLSPSGPFIASLTISLWALGKLGWSPNLPQAQILVRLLYQAAASGGLDLRHTALLLYGLGSLRLRPPAAAMEYLMARVGSGLPWAGMADLLQVGGAEGVGGGG